MMRTFTAVAICLLVLALPSVGANIAYDVTVHTTAIQGASGFLDFQFAGGTPAPPFGNLDVTNFSSDGTLGVGTLTNAVGSLPGGVTLTNDAFPPSDYLVGFTFGKQIAFRITFSGPAVDTPDGMSGSSTFGFFVLDNTQTPLIPNPVPGDDPLGAAFTADLDNQGKVAIANFASGEIRIVPASGGAVVPEPGTAVGVLSALALLAAVKAARRG